MNAYIGCKIINAEPMTLIEFNAAYHKVIPITSGNDGYKVIYPDGYVSWSPKSVFESAYREVNDQEKDML